MANRIIKESICTSDTLDELTPFQENTFYRLIVNCDDYGRMDGRPTVLASRLYPTRRQITEADMADAVEAMERAGLLRRYTVNGRPYIVLTTWEAHQRVRNSIEKYPAPPAESEENDNSPQLAATCGDSRQLAATRGEPRQNAALIQSNPIQSESVVYARARAREDAAAEDENELEKIATSIDEIFDVAEAMGMNTSADRNQANLLAADYSAPWVLEALKRTENAPPKARSWRYVKAILRRWREEGGPDEPEKPPEKARDRPAVKFYTGEDDDT